MSLKELLKRKFKIENQPFKLILLKHKLHGVKK
jgi:hypothetical protein